MKTEVKGEKAHARQMKHEFGKVDGKTQKEQTDLTTPEIVTSTSMSNSTAPANSCPSAMIASATSTVAGDGGGDEEEEDSLKVLGTFFFSFFLSSFFLSFDHLLASLLALRASLLASYFLFCGL